MNNSQHEKIVVPSLPKNLFSISQAVSQITIIITNPPYEWYLRDTNNYDDNTGILECAALSPRLKPSWPNIFMLTNKNNYETELAKHIHVDKQEQL